MADVITILQNNVVTTEVAGAELLLPMAIAASAENSAAALAAKEAAEDARDLAQQAVIDAEAQVALAADEVALAAAQVALATAQTALATAQAVLAAADRALAQAAAADATAAKLQAQSAALAATTGGLLTVMPVAPFTGVPSPFLLQLPGAGTAIYTHDTVTATLIDWLNPATFETVPIMLAFTGDLGPVGAKVFAGLYQYEVVTSGEHVTTAGGVKLIVIPGVLGYSMAAFGLDMTGVASASTALAAADAVAAAAGRPLIGSPGTLNLTASVTHAATVITNGVKFSFASSGVVQTFNAPFTAGRETVFVGALDLVTGPRWGSGSTDALIPEWFDARAYAVSGGTPFNSSPGIQQALYAASRSYIGFVYPIDFGNGLYGIADTLLKQPGEVYFRGQGASTQLRGMNNGSGYPDSMFDFQSSTFGMRFEKMTLYGGSSARPMKYGVFSTKLAHVNFNEVRLSSFSIAGAASYEWDNAFTNMEVDNCHAGIWLCRPGGNNNDITIETVRFVSCDLPLVINSGTSVGVRRCQFQATVGATGPYTKAFIWSQGVVGFSLANNYFETQPTGGLAGVAITVPTTLQLYAAVIFNHAPYFTDTLGTVTTTLSQSSANLGTVGSITDNLFATPAYWLAGAGGGGYTAGAVTYEAVTGTGTGASGTCAVTTGGIITTPSVSVPGQGFMIGDIVRAVQGGVNTGVATVLTTGANNGIASLYSGHAAAIYPGNVRRLLVTGNVFPASGAALALYNDRAVCDPRKLELRQNVTGGIGIQMIGPVTDTVDARLGNITISDALYDAAPDSGLGRRNYVPPSWAFSAAPTKSTFTRNSGRYKGYPWYRLKLNAGEQVTDILEFSFLIASSGAFSSELVGQLTYLTALKYEGAANTRLRLSLELTNGSNTLLRQNYDTGTSFTKAASESRAETSLRIGSTGGTLRGRIQVIAATAGEQYVDFGGLILTIAGVSVDLFDVASFERPLEASASWTPGPVAAGTTAMLSVPCLGARAGDRIETTDVTFDAGNVAGWNVARRAVAGAGEIHARNITSGTLGGWTNTMRVFVYPTT